MTVAGFEVSAKVLVEVPQAVVELFDGVEQELTAGYASQVHCQSFSQQM